MAYFKKLANTDMLTDVFNRNAYENTLRRLEEQEMELVSVKIGGKWYPVMVMEYEDEVAVMFLTSMIEMMM